MANVRITGTQRCVECGQFIADKMLPACHLHFEPLNEFGPEVCEWHCWKCVEQNMGVQASCAIRGLNR